jgi:hypothetical protein
MWIDGQRASIGANFYKGRQIARAARQLDPGDSFVITATIRTAPGADGAPALRTTPGVAPNNDSVSPGACD